MTTWTGEELARIGAADELELAARIAEDHCMSCPREDRSELAAHQSGTEDTDAHVYNLRVNHVS